jgi:hypothetical protein
MWRLKTYKNYKWIVQDQEHRGGSLRITSSTSFDQTE